MARDRRLLTRRARSAYRLQYSIAHVQVGVGNGKGAGVWLRARTFPFPSAKKVLRARLRGRDPSTGRAGPCARKHTPSRATASTGQSSGPHLAAPRGGDDEATGGDGGDDDGNSGGGGDDDDGMDGGGGKQRRQPRAGGAPASRTTHTQRAMGRSAHTRLGGGSHQCYSQPYQCAIGCGEQLIEELRAAVGLHARRRQLVEPPSVLELGEPVDAPTSCCASIGPTSAQHLLALPSGRFRSTPQSWPKE